MNEIEDRFYGALLGLACGDALGTTVEFSPRGSFAKVTGMTGGGPFHLKPGQWTDDTSMALCLAESFAEKRAFDPVDQMTRYLNWWQWGYLSSTGTCFDIGNTVRTALSKFQSSGDPFSGDSTYESAGNGSLMRLAPVAMFGFSNPATITKLAGDSSRTTHGAAEAIESCQLLALIIYGCLMGEEKHTLLDKIEFTFYQPKVNALSKGSFLAKKYEEIKGTGYCIDSLEAALWCFFNTNSYKEAVLSAVNLGDDADTTGAIAGQLAGAFYGSKAIPMEWREVIAMREDIEAIALQLYSHSAEKC